MDCKSISLEAIIKIESDGDTKAYNKMTGARGLFQITAICLSDWNQKHPTQKFMLEDLFEPAVNRAIAAWYFYDRLPSLLTHYGIEINLENILAAYNFGIGALKSYLDNKRPLPEETQHYIEKYKQLTLTQQGGIPA